MPGHGFCASHLKQSQCQLASPSLRERNQSCLSKRILLPNFLCSVALASRCVLSVPFPELAYNRNPAPPYRMQLVEKKELPKLPLPANISTALPSTAVTMRGQDFGPWYPNLFVHWKYIIYRIFERNIYLFYIYSTFQLYSKYLNK